MTSFRPYRLIVSGGGTGGHIFPAIAIATAFKERYPASEILFVGAKGKMEMTRVAEAGFAIKGLWIRGFRRRMALSNLLLPLQLVWSLWQARRIVNRFRPDVVIGTGGYASAPVALAASSKKTPFLVQEQNSYAGLANRWLARKADVVCVAYPNMSRYFPGRKIVLTGNPLRADLGALDTKKQAAIDHFSLDAEAQTLLVLGGSMGARTINESVLSGLSKFVDARVQVLWQTGAFYYPRVHTHVRSARVRGVRCLAFISRMDLAYAASHVVVARAGALTLSELCMAGKPAILAPSPNVAADHQTRNATALQDREAAVVVRDEVARDTLVDEALALLQDRERRVRLSQNIRRLAKPHATQDIIKEVEKLLCN